MPKIKLESTNKLKVVRGDENGAPEEGGKYIIISARQDGDGSTYLTIGGPIGVEQAEATIHDSTTIWDDRTRKETKLVTRGTLVIIGPDNKSTLAHIAPTSATIGGVDIGSLGGIGNLQAEINTLKAQVASLQNQVSILSAQLANKADKNHTHPK
jgi:hypothetical protein